MNDAESIIIKNSFTKEVLENYLALENSPIYQDMQKVTIEKYLPDLNGKRAYDVGFGTGFCLKILLGKGLQSYTGLDLHMDMVPYLKEVAQKLDPKTNVRFIQGDATAEKKVEDGRYDLVISTFAMYVNSYEKLLRYTNHLFKALEDDGTLYLMVLHTDFINEKWRENVRREYNNYFHPKLAEGESYKEFSKFQVTFTPPYLSNYLEFEEYVVGKETLFKALKEAGFNNILSLDMVCSPGKEKLLELKEAVGMAFYSCTKY